MYERWEDIIIRLAKGICPDSFVIRIHSKIPGIVANALHRPRAHKNGTTCLRMSCVGATSAVAARQHANRWMPAGFVRRRSTRRRSAYYAVVSTHLFCTE